MIGMASTRPSVRKTRSVRSLAPHESLVEALGQTVPSPPGPGNVTTRARTNEAVE